MSARTSLRAFLANARAALTAPAAQRASPLTLVVGNESADLDSLCSAVIYAYLRTHTPPHALHIPISNLPRDDLKLRPEMTAALAHAELKPSDLLTLDDLPSGADELAPKDTRWLLVDHNALTGDLGKKYSSRVVGCVDHHADENKVPQDTGAEPRLVENCGSCSSLVVDYCRSAWERSITAEDNVNGHLAGLALAAVLIDTNNLKSKDKTTEKDTAAVSFLEKIAGESLDRDAFFNEISAVKEDISSLCFRDIFRKDYKQWDDQGTGPKPAVMGVSAVVQNLEYLVGKAGGDEDSLLQEFKKWSEEKELDIGVIMTTARPDGKFQRELLIWAFNKNAVEACESFLKGYKDELGLEPWGEGKLDKVGADEMRVAWTQKSLSHSRKQVAPMLRDAIKGGARL